MPKGLRDRLCEFVETLQLSEDVVGPPAIPVAAAVELIEAAVPQHLQLDGEQLSAPLHPHGESFFSTAGDALSDEEAQRIAAEQLATTGFGPRS